MVGIDGTRKPPPIAHVLIRVVGKRMRELHRGRASRVLRHDPLRDNVIYDVLLGAGTLACLATDDGRSFDVAADDAQETPYR